MTNGRDNYQKSESSLGMASHHLATQLAIS